MKPTLSSALKFSINSFLTSTGMAILLIQLAYTALTTFFLQKYNMIQSDLFTITHHQSIPITQFFLQYPLHLKILVLAATFVNLALSTPLHAMTIQYGYSQATNEEIPFKNIYHSTFRSFYPLFLFLLAYSCLSLFPSVIGPLVSMLNLDPRGLPNLTIHGAIILINISMFIAFIYLIFTDYIIVIRGWGIRESLKHSYLISKNKSIEIFLLTIFLGLCFAPIVILLNIISRSFASTTTWVIPTSLILLVALFKNGGIMFNRFFMIHYLVCWDQSKDNEVQTQDNIDILDPTPHTTSRQLLYIIVFGISLCLACFWMLRSPSFQDEKTRVNLLKKAINTGDLKKVKKLLNAGTNPNERNPGLPIEDALISRHFEIVEELIRHKADVNGDRFSTPLITAAMTYEPKMVRRLIEGGADTNKRDLYEWTALMYAAYNGDLDSVAELLNKGASINLATKEGDTAYTLAGSRGFMNITTFLKDHGAEVRPIRIHERPILIHVVAENNVPITTAQKWALATVAIVNQAEGASHRMLGGFPTNGWRDIKINQLLNEWGIHNRKQTFERLSWLIEHGDREEFLRIKKDIAGLNDKEFSSLVQKHLSNNTQTAWKLTFTRNHYKELGNKGILAGDLGRYILLNEWAYIAGYITEEEAWKNIMPVAKQIQKNFSSWEDLGTNFMAGEEFSLGSRNLRQEAVFKLLKDKKDPGSPWNELKWETSLE